MLAVLQDHAQLAMAGDSADLVLTGVDASVLHSGCVLCHPEFPVRLAVKFIAQVLVLDVGMPLLKGHAVTIHTHSAREAGVISSMVALCDGKTGAVTKQRPRCLIGGQVSWASGVFWRSRYAGLLCWPCRGRVGLCSRHSVQYCTPILQGGQSQDVPV